MFKACCGIWICVCILDRARGGDRSVGRWGLGWWMEVHGWIGSVCMDWLDDMITITLFD